ncbi:hypothetical protein J6590_059634 [Homalodisca vitripennis]|nr:hypothetical protein J6590_059634 [Homalodisca vitripennis]
MVAKRGAMPTYMGVLCLQRDHSCSLHSSRYGFAHSCNNNITVLYSTVQLSTFYCSGEAWSNADIHGCTVPTAILTSSSMGLPAWRSVSNADIHGCTVPQQITAVACTHPVWVCPQLYNITVLYSTVLSTFCSATDNATLTSSSACTHPVAKRGAMLTYMGVLCLQRDHSCSLHSSRYGFAHSCNNNITVLYSTVQLSTFYCSGEAWNNADITIRDREL